MKIKNVFVFLISLAMLTACNANKPAASALGTAATQTDLQPAAGTPTNSSEVEAANTPIPEQLIPSPGSRSHYVSQKGNDNADGSKDHPYKTIGKAAQTAKAGDIVLIQAGIYYENVKPSLSGEPDKYILYTVDGDGEVIIDAQNGIRAGCIEIDDKSYLQFLNLTVRGANSYETWPRAGISITDGSHHIILDNITTYDNYFGIMALGRDNPVSDITVKNSKTFSSSDKSGNKHYGVFFYKKVYNSEIINNHVAYTMTEDQSYGIEVSTDYPGEQTNGSRNIVISGNEIHNNEAQGIHIWNAIGVLIRDNHSYENGATGIQIEDGSENIVIENNLSENNAQKYEFEAGIWVDHSKNALVRDNILRSNKVGLIITNSDRVIVHDNYLYLNNRGAQNLVNAAGLIVDNSITNIAVTQNTFYRNGANGMERGAVNFGVFNPLCSGITFKNNIIAETASSLDMLHGFCTGFVSDFNNFYNIRPLKFRWNQNEIDWTGYLTESGQDANSLTFDPLFEDPSMFNFTLSSESPLIGKGDFFGNTQTAGTGETIPVTDSGYFSDGFQIGDGDSIIIGDDLVKIIAINYDENLITVDRVISWEENEKVSFPYTGSAPSIGAHPIP